MRKAAGDNTEAEEFYRRVITIDPKNGAAHLNLGFLLEETGREAEGEAQLQRAVELDPSFASRIPKPTPSPNTTGAKP